MTWRNSKKIRIYSPFSPHSPKDGALRVIHDQIRALQTLGLDVEVHHWKFSNEAESFWDKLSRGGRFLLSDFASPELFYYPKEKIPDPQSSDAVLEIYHYSFSHAWIRNLPKQNENCRRVVHFHNLESDLFALRAQSSNPISAFLHGLNRDRLLKHEAELATMTDEQWFVSLTEMERYQKRVPGARTRLVSPGFDPELAQARRQAFSAQDSHAQPRIGLLGRYDFEPNRASLQWVLEHLCPELEKLSFKGVIDIVGKHVPNSLMEQGSKYPFVKFHGFVDDLENYWKTWSWILVPHVCGTGVRIKLLEAIASGIPVVANLEAICPVNPALHDRIHVLPLSSPQAWATCVSNPDSSQLKIELIRRGFPKELDPQAIYSQALGTIETSNALTEPS